MFVVWLLAVGWLVRYEAFPEFFTGSLGGYDRVLSDELLVEESWMRIMFDDRPLGYSHSSMERDDSHPLHHTTMRNHVYLRMSLLGEKQDIRVETEVNLDVLSRLQDFALNLWSRDYVMRVKAARRDGDIFKVSMRTGSSSQGMTVEIPDDVVIHSPMTQMAVKNLRPGQEMTMKTLDPTTMSSAPVTIRALRREPFLFDGEEFEATVLEVGYLNMKSLTWMDAEGRILREETPFGWILERCTFEEALAAIRDAGDADLLTGFAIQCRGTLLRPRAATALRLRLDGVPFSPDEFPSDRLSVASAGTTGAVVTVRAAQLPAERDIVEIGPDLDPMLESTSSLQSDHPEIRKRADSITKDARTSLAKALSIFDWVHENVEKEMTISLPSALDVLRTRKGDCNEHTVLFVALARAAGIPARTIAGVAYQEGAFFYHAWPAVYVGEWLEMDPTWGQKAVDATHLPLVQGELADQVQLLKTMGKLSITVMEEYE